MTITRLVYFITTIIVAVCLAEIKSDSASASLNTFTLRLFAEIGNQTPEENIVLSPYTVWNVMSVIAEGAHGNSAKQLTDALSIPSNAADREAFRRLQQSIIRNIKQAEKGVSLDVFNGIFAKQEATLRPDFQEFVRSIYNVELERLDFKNSASAADYINQKLSGVTRGRISNIISEESVRNSEMYIASALYFRGFWDKKFDKTEMLPFYNEYGQEIAMVPTMSTKGIFPSTLVLDKKANVIKLPYIDGRMSMLLFVPTKQVRLASVLEALSQTPITTILDQIKASYYDEVTIYLPKFKITSTLNLNDILQRMGVRDVFERERANLNGISPDKLYVSKILHKAEIEVDEEGTEGSALTVAEIIYLSGPSTLHINSPFAFVIFDEDTQSIVFTGKVGNPAVM